MISNRGIALIQVLIISTILSVLALYFSQTAHHQVLTAIKMKSHTKGLVAIHNAESDLLFRLMTSDRIKDNKGSITSRWNFWGDDFVYNDKVNVVIEDMSGFLSITFGSNEHLEQVLLNSGLSSPKVAQITQSLADWVDNDRLTRLNGAEYFDYLQSRMLPPRDGALQTLQEVALIKGIDQNTFNLLESIVTVLPTTYFNPMAAPEELLSLLLDKDVSQQVVRERESGTLNAGRFTALTGLAESIGQYFYPSTTLKLTIKFRELEVGISKTMTIKIAPASQDPLVELERAWNQG